jgi:hypothetical protein
MSNVPLENLPSSIRIERAVKKLEKMSTQDRLNLLVKAKLITPEQAAKAIKTIAAKKDA